MSASDLLCGAAAAVLLVTLGSLSLCVTKNHVSGLKSQWILFLIAFTLRFVLSALIYGSELHRVIIGDGDDNGWSLGLSLVEDWDRAGLGLFDMPFALLEAFKGHHRGYFYLLAIFFYFTRIPSQLAAAALSCCCGALTAVFAYRITRALSTEKVAMRVGWFTCLFPVMIIWSAQTIKEAFVIQLEIMALYGCIRLRISKFTVRHIALCGACVFVLASMRFYAAYITGMAVLLTLALPHLGRRKFALVGAIGVVAIVIPLLSFSGSLDKDRESAGQWDLSRTQAFKKGMASTAGSGVASDHDLNTAQGLGLATLVGGVHLLLSPFPWQLRAGSIRMILTTPEMLVWWFLFFNGVLPGLIYAIRHRFGDVLPMLVFLGAMGVIYSLTFGNVGTAYRQRAQLMPYLLVFAGLRLEQLESPRPRSRRTDRGTYGLNPVDPLEPDLVAAEAGKMPVARPDVRVRLDTLKPLPERRFLAVPYRPDAGRPEAPGPED